jgi:hypothetical protein
MEHLDEMLSGDVALQSNGMFLCKTCHLSFHGKAPHEQLWLSNGEPNQEVIQPALEELRSRLAHLNDKFRRLLEGSRSTLFVMKNIKIALDWEGAVEDIAALALWLEQHYKGGQYLLVVVVEERFLTSRLTRMENDHLTFRSVKEFSKEGKAQSGGDHEGWAKIFEEFDPDHTAFGR